MRICAYSCNFGNYRNELLKNNIDSIKVSKDVDYYFFTDNILLKSHKWNIIRPSLIEKDSVMDSYRWTSKYIKFVTPDIIKQYDIIIWCDNKSLKYINNLNSKSIINFFKNYKYKLVNIKHPTRNTLQEELKITMKLKLENIINGQKFLNETKNIIYNTPLTDTTFIIRKNDKSTNDLFENVYKLMKDNGLKRDQNVYNHAIYTINYEKKDILFIKN